MKPTHDRPEVPDKLQRMLRELLAELQQNPDLWTDKMRHLVESLSSFANSVTAPLDRRIRLETYEELARIVAPEVRLDWQAVRDWIVWKIEPDQPMTRPQFERCLETDSRLRPWHVVLQCTYQLEERKQYRRVCKAYLRQGDAPIKALEARRLVALEDLPREVSDAFLCQKETEMTFAIL